MEDDRYAALTLELTTIDDSRLTVLAMPEDNGVGVLGTAARVGFSMRPAVAKHDYSLDEIRAHAEEALALRTPKKTEPEEPLDPEDEQYDDWDPLDEDDDWDPDDLDD